MSVLDWFKRQIVAGDEAPAGRQLAATQGDQLTFAEGERWLGSLDMEAALGAHAAWKRRLSAVLAGQEEVPEIHKVARDDLCALGTWLHGEGHRTFGHTTEYQALLGTHCEFHLCVGEILDAYVNGDFKLAEAKNLDMRRKSNRIQLELVRLFVKNRAAA